MKRFLLKIWRVFPEWLQLVASRVIRPLFVVGVSAVIFDEHRRIFLGKSTYQRFHPWGILGGALEYGEHAEEAVVREVYEETTLVIKAGKLLMTRSFLPDKFILYFLCTIESGVFHPSDEVSEAGFYPLDALPDIRPRDFAVLQQIFEMMGFKEHELA